MTGRQVNEDRQNAIALGLMTYIGKTHPRCGTNVRYVNGGGCVHCGRVVATEQRQARIYLKKMQAEGALDTAPEPAVEPEKTFDESVEDLM